VARAERRSGVHDPAVDRAHRSPRRAVYALWRELRRSTIVLDPLEVPRELAERGYTPAVVTERL
jgi:hypothetical protein